MDIMDTIDKIGVTLTQTSKDIAKKAKDLVDVNSVKAAITDQKRVIAKSYERIGEQYYKDHMDTGSYEYEMEFETIGEANAKIKELYAELHALKKESVCPSCGATHSDDAVFCSKCGMKLEKEPVYEAKEEEVTVEDAAEDAEEDVVEDVVTETEEAEKTEDNSEE